MISISVVIPLYNKAPHIGRALDSVLAQTMQPQEIVVVDDGSTDGGGRIVTSYNDPRIKLISQENQGRSVARNRGIAEAGGEIIAFLDADDAWKPGFIEEIKSLIEKYPQTGAYATAFDIVGPDGSLKKLEFMILPPQVRDGLINNYFRVCHLTRYDVVFISAVAIPKRVLEEIGGFPEDVMFGLAEDLDVWLRIALRYPIVWSRERMAVYYQNAMNRSLELRRYQGEPRISQTARAAIQAGLVPQELIPDLKEYVAPFQLKAGMDCLVQGRRDIGLEMLAYARGATRFRLRCKWWLLRLLLALPVSLGSRLMNTIMKLEPDH